MNYRLSAAAISASLRHKTSPALARPRAVDLKQADAIALGFHHIETRARVNPHARRVAEVRTFDAWIKCIQPLAVATIDANLVENRVADVDISLVVHGHSGALIGVRQINGPP